MFHIISGKRKQHSHFLLLQYIKANLTKLTLPVKYLNHAGIANLLICNAPIILIYFAALDSTLSNKNQLTFKCVCKIFKLPFRQFSSHKRVHEWQQSLK